MRLFLRQDDYGRYFSAWCTCRATATPPRSGCELQWILLKELDGAVLDYTVRSTESVLTRLHFVVRVAAASGCPT